VVSRASLKDYDDDGFNLIPSWVFKISD